MPEPFILTEALLERLQGRIAKKTWSVLKELEGLEFDETKVLLGIARKYERRQFAGTLYRKGILSRAQTSLLVFYRALRSSERKQIFLRHSFSSCPHLLPLIKDSKILKEGLYPDTPMILMILEKLKDEEETKRIYFLSTGMTTKSSLLAMLSNPSFLFEIAVSEPSFFLARFALTKLKDPFLLNGIRALRPELGK